MRNALVVAAACLAGVMGSSGCGSSALSMGNATDSMNSGLAAFEAQDWETAEVDLTSAIESRTLNAKEIEEAFMARAQVRLQNENLSGAEEDLNVLEETGAKPDEVLLLKANLKLKQGDKAGAKRSYLMAKKINKKVKAPVGL